MKKVSFLKKHSYRLLVRSIDILLKLQPTSRLSCRGFLANLLVLYSMKIKEQTRKLAAGCSKHCFEVVDETDEVSNHTYGKAMLTRFEEIFEEYYPSI